MEVPTALAGTRARPAAGAFVLLALLAAAPTDAADDEFKKKARLKSIDINEMPLRAYELPRRVEQAAECTAVTTKIGKKNIVFVDIDGNGKFDDAGIDGWVVNAKGRNYISPVEEWIVVGGRRMWLQFGEDGKYVHYRQELPVWPARLPRLKGKDAQYELKQSKKEVGNGLLAWNDLRLRNGLPPIYLDEELTYGCILHARYMDVNGLGHDEDESAPGFSEEGRRAGKSGSVGSLRSSQEILGAYSTLYHRTSLFHPDTRGGGIGDARRYSCFNGTENREKRRWQWPVIIPAPDTEDVPLRFGRERPQPHEDLFRSGVMKNGGGFPITLTFERAEAKDVVAELRKAGPDGAMVPFALSSPEKPASPAQPTNFKTICLLPHSPLQARTTYWVKVSWTYRRKQGERAWTFKTGRAPK